eukprot:16079393-Heterocapsa_arctica.AAC.1
MSGKVFTVNTNTSLISSSYMPLCKVHGIVASALDVAEEMFHLLHVGDLGVLHVTGQFFAYEDNVWSLR